MLKIDETDEKILRILEENGRVSYRKLGQKIGIAESTARKRVMRLKQKGIIERFTVKVNHTKLGKTVTAFVTVYPKLKHAERIMKKVANLSEVLECYHLSGRCGVFAKVVFDNMQILNDFIARMRSIPGIVGIHTCISLETLKNG